MLKINNIEHKVIAAEIKYVNSTYNKENYYSISVSIDTELEGNSGYIKFYIDYFKDKKNENIENKKYVTLPSKLGSEISMIEIYDTKKFVDLIDSDIIVEFGSILDNKIETKININDEKIILEYDGLIDIK